MLGLNEMNKHQAQYLAQSGTKKEILILEQNFFFLSVQWVSEVNESSLQLEDWHKEKGSK